MLAGAGCTTAQQSEKQETNDQTNRPPASNTGGAVEPTPTTTPVVDTTGGTAVQPGSAKVSSVKMFFIELNDNGKIGPAVGCGDSAVPVQISIPPTTAPLTAAMKKLLAEHDQYYGMSGLYNSLYQSNLQLASAAVVNGVAVLKLTGTVSLGGVCDDPRFKSQIEETAKQFSTVKSVEVYVNGSKWTGGGQG